MRLITQLGAVVTAGLVIVGLITGATAAFYGAAVVGFITFIDYISGPADQPQTPAAPAPAPVVEEAPAAPVKKTAAKKAPAKKATAPAPAAKKTPAAKKAPAKTAAKKTTKK